MAYSITGTNGHCIANGCVLTEAATLLQEVTDELANEIKARYPMRNQYPDIQRRYDRDMDVVNRARAFLEQK